MFILCPHCQFLVALDPASGQPPKRCPRCRQSLKQGAMPTATPAPEADAVAVSGRIAIDPPAAADVVPADATPVAIAPSHTAEVMGMPRSAAEPGLDAITPAVELPADTAPAGPVPLASDLAREATDVVIPTPNPTDPDAPRFVQRERVLHARARRRSGAPALLAIGALGLLLVLQLLLADRTALARDPRWRPALAQLCGVAGCSLPPWHEPSAFTLLDRDVRPGAPGVLHVNATFRNDARWPQRWPALLLTLSDLDGATVGARLLQPRDYLGMAPPAPLLASGQSARFDFDVVEPGRRVVAFNFDFR